MNLPNGMDASIVNERLLVTKESKTVFSLLPEDVAELSRILNSSLVTQNISILSENKISIEDLQLLNAIKEYEESLPELKRPLFRNSFLIKEWKEEHTYTNNQEVPDSLK